MTQLNLFENKERMQHFLRDWATDTLFGAKILKLLPKFS